MDIPDADFATAKSTCYRGLVRVALHALDFDHRLAVNKHREVAQQNVKRLEKIFERVGCLRLQEDNVVNAVIPDDDLSVALASRGMTLDELRSVQWPQDAPVLDLRNVKCLSGLHQTPKPILIRIVESYSNEEKPSDGEIFRKIRLYHREGNEEAENRWWSRLDKSKPKDLRQLLKRTKLALKFDALIDMPGLWAKVQIGALHRLLVLKCDEEMIEYLSHVVEAWKGFLRCGQTTLPFSVVDTATVQNLELLVPKYSDIDKESVVDLMERRVIFPSQVDQRIRKNLVDNICAFPGAIPSLRTFFEMLKYLEPICEALRQLLGENLKNTIRSSLMGRFFAPAKTLVQASETEDVEIKPTINKETKAMIAYTELWAFCGRHSDGLTAFTPRKEVSGAKPRVNGPNPVIWQHLARFAISRGFRIPHAEALVEKEGDFQSQLALEYLQKANPTTPRFSSAHVQQVLVASQVEDTARSSDRFDTDTEHMNIDRRSGRPFARVFAKDKEILFFPRIYDTTPCKHASLSLMRHDLYSRIFGRFEFQIDDFGPPTSVLTMTEAMDIDTPSDSVELLLRCEALKEENRNLQVQRDEIERKYTTDHNRLEQLKKDLAIARERIESTNSKYDQVNTLYLRLKQTPNDTAELLLRYEALHEENRSLLFQRDALEGKYTADCSDLRNNLTNAQERIERATFEYDQINTLYLGLKQKHSTCQATIDHLRNKAPDMTKRKKKLESRRAQIQQERNDVQQSSESNALIRIESAAASVEFLEGNDELILEDQRPCEWNSCYNGEQHEIFIALSNAADGNMRGYSYLLSQDPLEAITSIEKLLREAKERFSQSQYGAMTILGKHLTPMTPTYLLQCLAQTRTIFIGPSSILAAYNTGTALMKASSLQGPSTIAEVTRGIRRQRDDSDDDDERLETITASTTDGRIIRYAKTKLTEKRRLLEAEPEEVVGEMRLLEPAPAPAPEAVAEEARLIEPAPPKVVKDRWILKPAPDAAEEGRLLEPAPGAEERDAAEATSTTSVRPAWAPLDSNMQSKTVLKKKRRKFPGMFNANDSVSDSDSDSQH
ncbi:uncharacterized protein K460DRAFT_399124 [Cucurbitaria berberidis CBS 394.84]|uniref:Uncharacterized protein n=1 Tax=Cucurbitaria berberidis CBS 394.84 TaxID=1168544 RepID=A0A9P4G7F7_9PLEO|nr:uncharacterized protein K460DRAFT_399124 [Cucurbitaria berberidis CBS 394.84]KAF1840100.1 hypothetical protein K460DRAFT_399124 [Cucurbitaria berberidis CBS 394.84]